MCLCVEGVGRERERESSTTYRCTLNLCHEVRFWSATDLQDSIEVIAIYHTHTRPSQGLIE